MLEKRSHGMNYDLFIYIVLPLFGIGCIVFALGWGMRLGQRPVEIGFNKLGLTVKADLLTLLVLLGFVLAGVGAFFAYQGYEAKLVRDAKMISQEQAKTILLQNELESFKVYDMSFHLIFPEPVDVRRAKIQIYITKKGQGPPQLSTPETDIGIANDLWVKMKGLTSGDKFRIVAMEGIDKNWVSADMEIPKAQIQMSRVNP
jgi:hypothetical protein